MGDLKSGETFEDRVYITNAAGVAAAGLTTTCKFYDEEGNETAGTTAELGNGLYHCTDFTPDANGTWNTIWAVTDEGVWVIHHQAKEFKVGGGIIADVKAETATIVADTNELQTDLHDGGRLDALIDAIKAKTDNLPVDPADDSDLDASIAVVDGLHDVPVQDSANNAQMRDVLGNKTDTAGGNSVYALFKALEKTETWFSDPQEEVAVTNGAGDKALPSVVLPNIAGEIVRVKAGFKFRMIENTSGSANKLDGAQEIQVKENAAGAFTDAINFVDDQFSLAATTREGGDCIIGDIDVVAEVAVFNKTYAFQWDEAVADEANLQFNDVQTFLIVTYRQFS